MEQTEKHIVSEAETAAKMGSGLLPVYATPSVVALMEHTACQLIANIPQGTEGSLDDTQTTVGTKMDISHVKACLVGEEVESTAVLECINGRQYDFRITVTNSKGDTLATALHTRFAVDKERFMGKLR